MRRIAFTAKHATSRIPIRTSPGFLPRAVAGQTIRICEWILHAYPSRRSVTADLAPVPNPNLLKVVRTGISPQKRGGTANPKPNPPKAVVRSTQASRCCPYPGLKSRWTCQIRAVIAGRAQTVHFAQCGRAEGVRPPNGVNRDPFATFAACGGGRHGCTRHHLAGDAFCPGAAAAT